MAYETKPTSISTNTSSYEPSSFCSDTARKSYSDSISNPFGEFYSVGIDETIGLKEKITDVHGTDSEQVGFINDLEDFLGNSDKYSQASQKFKNYVRNHIKTPRNADFFVDEFTNSGYILALERLRAPSSGNDLDYYKDYAASHNITVPQAVMYGPNGTAKQAFSKWRTEEFLRGQHRSDCKPENEQMAKIYEKATTNTYGLPAAKNKSGDFEQIAISDDKNDLPVGIEGEIVKAFGRERKLYNGSWYKGTKRLSGDLAYRIVEAMAIELLAKQNNDKSSGFITSQSELEKIIENANESGQDAFLALYDHCGKNKKPLKYAWNKARETLNDYAETLWQQRDTFKEQIAIKSSKELPGTIYLNNGRYYWMPKNGEKTVALVPEKEKNKLPGSLFRNKPGGYFWWIPDHKFRRRMIPDGRKCATKDLNTAKKLQQQEWKNIQKYEPKLAAELKGMRKWGVATKHKPTATKIAKKYWNQMQKSEPQTVVRIMSDKRPEINKPDIDVVWPSWTEQKERLSLLENKLQMPIVYPKQNLRDEWKYGLRVPEKLESMVKKVKKVDWLAKDAMLVFEDKSPIVSKNIAIQSNGKEWTEKQYQENNQCYIQGCASIDKDSGRFKFTVYNPGYNSESVLAEEVYHVVFEVIREASPKTFKTIQKWHNKNINNGSDPTLNISETFSQAMAKEELGYSSSLPRNVVKCAKKVFSGKNGVKPCVVGKVKSNLSIALT